MSVSAPKSSENAAQAGAPVCLVTGGTSGIGWATVQKFSKAGYRIATCGRNVTALRAAESRLSGGNDSLFLNADLALPADVTRLFRDTMKKLGRIDVLVNNAAVAPLAPFDELTTEVLDETLRVNIRAVVQLTQEVWRQMKKQGQGVIVNISSLAAVDPFPGFSLYGATKAWLDLMTTALAREGQEWGIRVYSIRPGAVETPMLRNLFPDFPENQCLLPDQVADAVWKCVSEPTRFESGKSYVLSNQSA